MTERRDGWYWTQMEYFLEWFPMYHWKGAWTFDGGSIPDTPPVKVGQRIPSPDEPADSPAPSPEGPLDRLLNVARGCHDYGGGYKDPVSAEIYHHGIATVISALEAAAKNDPSDGQVNALERIGVATGAPGEAAPVKLVCVNCKGPAIFRRGEGLYRHAAPDHEVICDRYGYPIEVEPEARNAK